MYILCKGLRAETVQYGKGDSPPLLTPLSTLYFALTFTPPRPPSLNPPPLSPYTAAPASSLSTDRVQPGPAETRPFPPPTSPRLTPSAPHYPSFRPNLHRSSSLIPKPAPSLLYTAAPAGLFPYTARWPTSTRRGKGSTPFPPPARPPAPPFQPPHRTYTSFILRSPSPHHHPSSPHRTPYTAAPASPLPAGRVQRGAAATRSKGHPDE